MLFVFFRLDAIYINENYQIVEIKQMKPFWPYYKAKHKAKYILETTEKHNLKEGDKLIIENDYVKSKID